MSTPSADILAAIRALPRDERIRVVDQLVHELAESADADERVAALVAQWGERWNALDAEDRALVEAAAEQDRKYGSDWQREEEDLKRDASGRNTAGE